MSPDSLPGFWLGFLVGITFVNGLHWYFKERK